MLTARFWTFNHVWPFFNVMTIYITFYHFCERLTVLWTQNVLGLRKFQNANLEVRRKLLQSCYSLPKFITMLLCFKFFSALGSLELANIIVKIIFVSTRTMILQSQMCNELHNGTTTYYLNKQLWYLLYVFHVFNCFCPLNLIFKLTQIANTWYIL